MQARHMQVLNQWRDQVVREGDTTPVQVNGVDYPKSLTRGCMACHASRVNFCARCHTYADVSPNCWSCHVEPGEDASDQYAITDRGLSDG